MQKVLITILAVTVMFANALCACVAGRHADAACAKSVTKACCQHAPVRAPKPIDAPHACPHCSGTMSAEAGASKTTVDAPEIVLSPFIAAIARWPSFDSSSGPVFRQPAVPPPSAPPRTLLDLGCCLTV